MNPPSFLAASAFVAVGGGFGAWLRFLTGRAWSHAIGPVAASAFPWATLTVNASGSFAMGVLAGWLARYGAPGAFGGEGLRLLLGVGVLGGFTTFSAFSLELVLMIERAAMAQAAIYIAVSLLAGVGGLFAGLALMRNAV
jgi:fluoride exporter